MFSLFIVLKWRDRKSGEIGKEVRCPKGEVAEGEVAGGEVAAAASPPATSPLFFPFFLHQCLKLSKTTKWSVYCALLPFALCTLSRRRSKPFQTKNVGYIYLIHIMYLFFSES